MLNARAFVLASSLLAAGCVGGAPPVDVNAAAVTVCPGATTVEGIDVSEFQGTIDWAQVKASGRQFAFIRVSDGTYQDPNFATNWANAKAAGVLRGAYQFFRASDDPITIADQFLAKIGTLGPGDLPPVLDVEVTDGQSATTLRTNMETWLAHVEQKTGKTPFIYVSPGFWPSLGSPNESHYRLWVANWQVTCPNTPTGWSSWQMWQYADNGTVPGISGNVDLDRFDGSLQQLQQLADGAPYAAEYVSQSWPLASTALQMLAGDTVAASITLKNTGSKAWDTNTKLGTTQARDRASAFADSSWLAPNRAAHVTGTVAPGGTFTFKFNFHAPSTPGTYHEYFDLVEEGVAWFSDPGQGGPADNQIEAWIEVAPNPHPTGGGGSGGGGGGGGAPDDMGGGSQPGDPGTGGNGTGGSGGAADNPSSETPAPTSVGTHGGCSVAATGRVDACTLFALCMAMSLLRRRLRRG